MRVRLIALWLLAGIFVPASSALAAPPFRAVSPSGIGIRLTDVPVDSRNDPRARSYIIGRLAPGTTIRRHIEIVNSTRSTADVAVYPAAARLQLGRFAFAPGQTRNALSRWTSVSRRVLRLPPGASAFETVTITVPTRAATGKRYGVVWAQVSARRPAKGGVRLVNRVGVRMYLSIAAGGVVPSHAVRGGPVAAARSATRVLVVSRHGIPFAPILLVVLAALLLALLLYRRRRRGRSNVAEVRPATPMAPIVRHATRRSRAHSDPAAVAGAIAIAGLFALLLAARNRRT
jgi:hypothetical protein